jgi:hypothetical protein
MRRDAKRAADRDRGFGVLHAQGILERRNERRQVPASIPGSPIEDDIKINLQLPATQLAMMGQAAGVE